MRDLPYSEKLRILSHKAEPNSWELVAELTHHSKTTVIEVGKWLQSLPWEQVRNLPERVQWLRMDYLEQKSREFSQPGVKVSTGTEVLPANSRRIYHGLGVEPSWVDLQVLEGPVVSQLVRGAVSSEYFEARAIMSGVVVTWRAVGSVVPPPCGDIWNGNRNQPE